MKRRTAVFISALLLGLVIGVAITAKFNLSPTTNAEEKSARKHQIKETVVAVDSAVLDENAFIKVAEEVGPTVVSISTEHITKIRPRVYQSPFGRDDFFDRFFEDLGLPSLFSEETGFTPAFDVSETESELTVKAELPGMDEKEIDISLSDGMLTIKGEKKHEKEEEKKCYHTVERRYGAFSRTMRLPSEVEAEKVDATYRDGVLKVTLPKSETAKARKIEIKG